MLLDVDVMKHAEDRLRASEARYRTLFDSMEQGYAVIEVLFDADDRPADFRYLEVNPAFDQQSGLRGVTGRQLADFPVAAGDTAKRAAWRVAGPARPGAWGGHPAGVAGAYWERRIYSACRRQGR